ncbi:MAG: fumarate hydratase [Flavobacteriaceae bacterium]|nr:fumarate hydratase [Flavobacteriaceae bacterium]
MNTSTISGDIVAFTSLSNKSKLLLEKKIQNLINLLEKKYKSFCRIVKGDYLECVVNKPEQALRIAILIKCSIKSIELDETSNKRFRYFRNYGIRLAISLGKLKRFNKKKGIIDGEAIYMSGRKINEESTHNKERIVIKNTLFFVSKNEALNFQLKATIELLDFILNKTTSKQCEVLYYKLLDYSETEISKIMKISQPVVNQHSISAGWNAIETAVNTYSVIIKNN